MEESKKSGRYKLGSGQNTKVSMGDRWRVRVIWKMRQRNEEWREIKREKKGKGKRREATWLAIRGRTRKKKIVNNRRG